MLTQPVVFEHVQQRGFASVIQAQEHQFARLLVQTWEEKRQAGQTPAGSSSRRAEALQALLRSSCTSLLLLHKPTQTPPPEPCSHAALTGPPARAPAAGADPCRLRRPLPAALSDADSKGHLLSSCFCEEQILCPAASSQKSVHKALCHGLRIDLSLQSGA